uniref:Uncharacterized protein n=1 Tax=Tanacetum cinerariifolium TaxID=118510 RepID=A0A6L2JJW7_TANCI|nr:hypothetical protein [Tanacetum cinerariifolium]
MCFSADIRSTFFQGRLYYSFWHKAIFFPHCKPSRSETYVSASVKEIDYVQHGIFNQAELKLQPRAFFSFYTAAYTELVNQFVGESSSPRKSLKIRTRQHKPTSITPLAPSNDQERDGKAYEERDDGEEESDGTEFADTVLLSDEDSGDRLEPESHKENPKKIDDDDQTKDEKHDDVNDDHDDHALIRTRGIKEKVNEALEDIVPKLATTTTNDLINDNYQRIMANAVKKEKESSQAVVPALISQESAPHAPKIIEELLEFTCRIPFSMCILQQAKFKKSSALVGSCRNHAFLKLDHDEHQGDDAPLEGEKSANRQKTLKSSKSIKGSSSKQLVKETNTSASEQKQQQHDWDAWVDTIVIDEDEVLKEVKMKIFETEFMKKAPLLGSLDLKIMKAYVREIMKCLKHRKQMRRCKMYVNGHVDIFDMVDIDLFTVVALNMIQVNEPLIYDYLRPLTSLDELLYTLAYEEDDCYLATLVRSFKLIEIYIEHDVMSVDSYNRQPPWFRTTIEDIIDKPGSIAAIEHRSKKYCC